MAPSSCNAQPWAFRRANGGIEIVADPGHAPAGDEAGYRETVVSCGAALFNMRVALRHFGWHDVVLRGPDPRNPRLLARLVPGKHEPEMPRDRSLFYAIPRRHTVRTGFLRRPVPSSLIEQSREAANAHGAWLHAISDPNDRRAVADLVHQALMYPADVGGDAVCDSWPAPPDVIPAPAADLAPPPSTVGRFAAAAAAARWMMDDAAVLLLLGTAHDDADEWLAAGEALEEVLLCAAVQDVSAAYANQPLRIPSLRPLVAGCAGCRGVPHVLFALGHAAETTATPRRAAADTLARAG